MILDGGDWWLGYWWWEEMVGRRYFSGNPKVGHSGKSRQVPTLHPGTPPAKREGLPPNV